MEFLAILSTISEAVSTFKKLRSFVNNEMGDLLNRLGDGEFEEAQKHLAWSQSSSNAKMHINNAATLFRLAKSRYFPINRWNYFFKEAFVESMLSKPPFEYARMVHYQRACLCLVLAAACYKYLDETVAARETLKEAQLIFDEYLKELKSEIESVTIIRGKYSRWINTERREQLMSELSKQQREFSVLSQAIC
ncbi:hypothetical protein Q2T42_21740 [Leptolyngbya boryana CZ1]|uniref:Uncharacterized protein n=1 Tax=Leptolyngbya boryana CZ1 TaxID=3060204 RepID=A0AA96WS26_LEPBY|nr:hypothetical protein [Leptolyngbya boryana]WNZ44428.1 hypothetical protein Q2T42_21740 [Leptolyngbya boryana CZ1]